MKKDDIGCLLQCVAILVINAIGIYFVRSNTTIKGIVETFYLPLFFLVFIGSLVISGISKKHELFWQDIAGMSRFILIVFIPIYLASTFK